MLLLESVALNLYELGGLPDIPLIEVLTIISFNVFKTSVGGLGLGAEPEKVKDAGALRAPAVPPRPFSFVKYHEIV